MAAFTTAEVLDVHHWNDTLFSFRTTREPSFRFRNGHFVMLGLEVEGRPLMRAYSIASANHEDTLEFFSIKVPDGPLTSRLQNLRPGDEILLSRKPTGTLVTDHLLPGRNLWMLGTGTGLAPFMSLIRDPETYETFDRVILVHGVRFISELAYQHTIVDELPNNPYFGELVKEKLLYYPTVTREPYPNQGRINQLLSSGKLESDLGLPPINVEEDRFMLCGSPPMLKDLTGLLNERGFRETRQGELGEYVIERAFVEQ